MFAAALTVLLAGGAAIARIVSRDYQNEPIRKRTSAALGWFSGIAAFCAAATMMMEAESIGHAEPLSLLNAATWPLVLAIPSGCLAFGLWLVGRSKPLSEIGK